jgi:hypothetical protein
MRPSLATMLCLQLLLAPALSQETTSTTAERLQELTRKIEDVAKGGDSAHAVTDDIQALGDMGADARSAIPTLIAALGIPNYRHVDTVHRALRRIGGHESQLLEAFISGDGGVSKENWGFERRKFRRNVAEAIRGLGLGAVPAIPSLTAFALSKQPAEDRIVAVNLLSQIHATVTQATIAAFTQSLEQGDRSVRGSAAKALTRIARSAHDSVTSLAAAARREALQGQANGDEDRSAELGPILTAIETVDPSAATDTLMALQRNANVQRHGTALNHLIWLEPNMSDPQRTELFTMIDTALDSALAPAQSAAVNCVAILGTRGQPFIARLLAILRNPKADARTCQHAISATRATEDRSPVTRGVLIDLLDPNNPRDLNWHAVDVLDDFGALPATAVPKLIAILKEPKGYLHATVAKLLGEIGPAAAPAIELLRKQAADGNELERAAAQKALLKIQK